MMKEKITHNLAVAAYLSMKGHRLLEFRPAPGRAYPAFVFEDRGDNQIRKDQNDYFDGAVVPAYEFYTKLYELKAKSKETNEVSNHGNTHQSK